MPEFIYTMKDLRKVVPPKREILKGIWLSFFYGAKIGVIGHNGAGKSSLLRIMAGLDDSFMGEVFPAKGATVGFLHQEPQLDPSKTVLGNVEEGVAAKKAIVDRYSDLMANYSEETADEWSVTLLPRSDNEAFCASPRCSVEAPGARRGQRTSRRPGRRLVFARICIPGGTGMRAAGFPPRLPGRKGGHVTRTAVAQESPTIRAERKRTERTGGASSPNGPAVTDRGPYGHGRG